MLEAECVRLVENSLLCSQFRSSGTCFDVDSMRNHHLLDQFKSRLWHARPPIRLDVGDLAAVNDGMQLKPTLAIVRTDLPKTQRFWCRLVREEVKMLKIEEWAILGWRVNL